MAGAAHAQSASDQADAQFQRGKALMAEGEIAEACAAFDESQRLDPSPATVMNQANCRERNGQLATARALFLEAAQQTSAMREPKWKKTHATATGLAARLDPRLSTLRIDVAPGNVVEGLEVTRDGAIVTTASWNRALPVDGGTYRISARAPDRVAWTETVTIAVEREARLVEVPRLDPVLRAPEPSIDRAGAGPDAVPARPTPAMPVAGGSTWTGKRKVAVGLVAVGVAELGAGTVLGLLSNRKRNETDTLCPDPQVRCDAADRANALSASARRLAIGADVAFGLAAGAATAAVILWMTGAPESRTIAIAPAASPGQFAVTASRSW
jgi:tetratricopeptide (TPR) repeat protein